MLLLGYDNKGEKKQSDIIALEIQINALEKAKNIEKISLDTHQKDVKTLSHWNKRLQGTSSNLLATR